MKKKSTQTYSIDDKLYEYFDNFIRKNHLNKSGVIVSLIRKYCEDVAAYDKQKIGRASCRERV